MMLLISAGSLVMVYLGLELLALCSYALVAIDRDSRAGLGSGDEVLRAGLAGLRPAAVRHVAGLRRHRHALTSPRSAMPRRRVAQPTLLLTGVVFMVAGIAFKFGAAPFHMWLPDVYHGAPTPITLFIGSAPKLAAFGMAFRLLEVGAGAAGRALAADAGGAGRAVAGGRQPDRAGADQPQAHAGVLDHLARRLPVPRPGRRRRGRLRGGDVLRDQLRDDGRPRRSARSWCCRAAASRPTTSTTSRA